MRDLILQLSKSSIYSTKPSHCRKTWQLQFTYTASQPGTHQKIIDMAMNGVGCRAT
ncbi:IS1-like element transposase, partial [Escherichia coli]|uniref:IS1-like element transposase n=1 Tax=Escherichia coli TaxID=562 RepID=UPI00218077B2